MIEVFESKKLVVGEIITIELKQQVLNVWNLSIDFLNQEKASLRLQFDDKFIDYFELVKLINQKEKE